MTVPSVQIEWAGPDRAAMMVPVHINGRGPYAFILDTGATVTCVHTALAAELALPEPTGARGIGAGIVGSRQLRLLQIDSLRVGGVTAQALPACVVDLGNVQSLGIELDGLLGLNFLRDFQLTIDFERSLVFFDEPGGSRPGITSVP